MYAVDVPIDLWHDSIATFDERWPDARGDLRVLKQMLELTPQLCPVDPVPYLSAEGS